MVECEVIPINYEMQKLLRAKLEKIEAAYRYTKSDVLKTKIDELKRSLRSLRPYVRYTVDYKGIKKSVLVAGDQVQLKYVAALRQLIQRDLQKLRVERRRVNTYNHRFMDQFYEMCGGTFREAGAILKLTKGLRIFQLQNKKSPNTSDNYIGLEIECFGILNRKQLEEVIIQKKMHKWCRTVTDSSIHATEEKPHPIELNFMFKESEIETRMKEIDLLLTEFKAEANGTCGLHVHLDARNRNVETMFHNLVSFQNLFFQLNPSRIGNSYCVPVSSPVIQESDIRNHYAAISSSAYQKYRTIEVRIHAGSTDMKRITMWLKLLTRIVNYSEKLPIPQSGPFNGLDHVPNLSGEEKEFFRSAI